SNVTEDAARKYCLGKFTKMFTGIFMQYPHIQLECNAGESGDHNKAMVERKPEELTERATAATAFATHVEQAVFHTYSEPDRLGNPGTGVKYKERFRTFTFNFQQSVRVALHKRISSGQVAPKTLSTMSSTDLASLEQQQSMKQAEQEALEQFILIKKAVPRSKIT
ncbi:transcription factor S-II, central domain-containing protein, partial [Russula earlei]